jgi:hypothetical protein
MVCYEEKLHSLEKRLLRYIIVISITLLGNICLSLQTAVSLCIVILYVIELILTNKIILIIHYVAMHTYWFLMKLLGS